MNVTLFNELGDAYEKTLIDEQDKEVVVIISAAKIHKFDGTKYLLIQFILMYHTILQLYLI